jgi:hyperosmotically inducible protein
MPTQPWVTSIVLVACACMLGACDRHMTIAETLRAHQPTPASQPTGARAPAQPEVVEVPAGGPERLSDGALTDHIRAAILSEPRMAGADVSVNAEHGVVSLTGNVKSEEQAAIASALAQSEDGVMRIDNHLALSTQ